LKLTFGFFESRHDKEMDELIIYELTSPSGKRYIGQVVEYLSNKEKKGLHGRWLQHVRSARSANPEKGCRMLNSAIRKYGSENFTKKILVRTTAEFVDFFEELCIKIRNSLVPHGYNLQSGGQHHRPSEQTKQRMSRVMKRKLSTPEMREKWSKAKLGKPHRQRKRRKTDDNSLPKYIVRYKSGKYEGYEVNCHPTVKGKKFTKSKFSMAQRLQMAKDYIENMSK